MPRSQAFEKEGISQSMFLTIVRGLRRQEKSEQDDIREVMHPSWEDELVHDITGDEYFYLPEDFHEELNRIEETFLSKQESSVIELLYPGHLTNEETAGRMGISVPTVRSLKKNALSTLREHSGELYAGRKLMENIEQVQKEQKKHQQSLGWMQQALGFLGQLSDDEDSLVEDQPVSQEALSFYRRNGLTRLSDVCRYRLGQLFTSISDEFMPGEMLGAVRESDDFSLDSPLDESIGIDTRTAHAFEEAGIHTVREFLRLPEDEIFSIRGVGAATIVHIWRRVLFG